MSAQHGVSHTITGTVGTSPITVLAAGRASCLLSVHNPNLSNGDFLAVTYDGVTTPVVYGAGKTISPGGDDQYIGFVPNGAVQIVGSTSGTAYTVTWL